MSQIEPTIESLKAEYCTLLKEIGTSRDCNRDVQCDIIKKLENEGSWTAAGAEQIVGLARNYGAFMLRNALALALALEIEDGDLAF